MRTIALTIFAFALLLSAGAVAQEAPAPAMSAMPAESLDESAPIKLSPDGPAVIKLDEDAASIIVGNPRHATALLENPRLMMLVPEQPGATKVIALNREGKAIFNRHVLVGTGKSGFKRVSRVCATANTGGCVPVSMYYCPDKCYETAVSQSGGSTGASGDLSNPMSDTPDNPSEGTASDISEGMSILQ